MRYKVGREREGEKVEKRGAAHSRNPGAVCLGAADWPRQQWGIESSVYRY